VCLSDLRSAVRIPDSPRHRFGKDLLDDLGGGAVDNPDHFDCSKHAWLTAEMPTRIPEPRSLVKWLP
jgi:hypothetical protein